MSSYLKVTPIERLNEKIRNFERKNNNNGKIHYLRIGP